MDAVPAVAESAPQQDQQEAVEVPTDAPEGGEESASSPDQSGEKKSVKAENRYQKLANDNRKYREELQQMKVDMAGMSGLKEIEGFLKSNPDKAKIFLDWMIGQNEPKAPTEDPYKDFRPEVAAKFRELDDLKKWKSDFENNQKMEHERSETQSRSQVYSERDNEFNDYLKADGYLDKDGRYDESVVEFIEDAVFTRLMRTAQDPLKPSRNEFKDAYDAVCRKAAPALTKMKMKSFIKEPGVPPSGSRGGIIPPKGKDTEKARLARIQSMLGA